MLTEKEKTVLQKAKKRGTPLIILGIILILSSLGWFAYIYYNFRLGPDNALSHIKEITPQTKTEYQFQQIIIEDHRLFDQSLKLFKLLLIMHVSGPLFLLGGSIISIGCLHKQYATIIEKLQRER